jgi:uncharacterized Tic20 family protein
VNICLTGRINALSADMKLLIQLVLTVDELVLISVVTLMKCNNGKEWNYAVHLNE